MSREKIFMKKQNDLRPFGLRDKIGYMFGDFGNDFTFILSTILLTKFYTDVMGISAAAVGTVMMIARFVDGFTDITMGRICDRSKVTRAGKFKPWLLRMAIPTAVSSFIMYQHGLSYMSNAFKIGYFAFSYILWGSFFYTSVNIPYGSMASAISREPSDRQSLSTFRTVGGMLAGVIIGTALPLIAYTKNEQGVTVLLGERVTFAAGVFSVLAVISHFLCYYMVSERVVISNEGADASRKKSALKAMLLGALKNRALISIIAASVVMLLAQLTMQNMASYIYPDYYNNASAQSASTAIMAVSMLLAALAAKPLAERFGKAEVSAVSNIFASAVSLVTFFARPESVWVFCALQGLNWLGLGVFSMVSWALITDVIDYSELKNGVREDGAVYSMYSFARKLGQALAAGASGWLLTLIGYDTEAAREGVGQSADVLSGIFGISTLIPALGFFLLALVLWFWYPLRKKEVEKNVSALKAKHEDGKT